jgi:hypothetical protein
MLKVTEIAFSGYVVMDGPRARKIVKISRNDKIMA